MWSTRVARPAKPDVDPVEFQGVEVHVQTKRLPDSWLRYNAMSMLGEVLTGLGRHDETEPLLLKAFEKDRGPPCWRTSSA